MRTLSVLVASLIYACLLAGPTAAADVGIDKDRELAKTLAMELKAALTTALQKSPEAAIGVCNERAPQIAKRLGGEHNAIVGRTALRTRNPANQPNEWQRAVLLDFQNRLSAGEAPGGLEFAATVTANGQSEHRFMKAIATEPLCLTCHGPQVAPSVLAAIKAKYPNDTATGFNVGDLRGAVYVIRRETSPPNAPASRL